MLHIFAGLSSQSAIDAAAIEHANKEKGFWKSVLRRLIDITLFLAERNLAFRGSNEVLGSTTNGNFLGLFELMAKYDPVLAALQERTSKSENSRIRYLNSSIQNELIGLVAKEALKANLDLIKQAKYCSVILNCTPDISHKEQMSIVFRFVRCTEEEVEIREAFLGFLVVEDTTGKGLLETFLKQINEWDLSIQDCRGQSYDNGSNMRGKNNGVQARILSLNPKALYVPCAAHSLNLVICDAAKASSHTITFFGTVARLFSIFSSSPARWAILKSKLPVSLKQPSDTRWESHVACVAPLRYHLPEVCKALDALCKYAEEKQDGKTLSEAKSLRSNIEKWSFILSVIIWHEVLNQLNKTSKLLQKSDIAISVLQLEISASLSFLQDFREAGYDSVVSEAKGIAESLRIKPAFPSNTRHRKRALFAYETRNEAHLLSEEEDFKVDVLFKILDQALTSLRDRFALMSKAYDTLDFLFNRKNLLEVLVKNELEKKCRGFQQKFDDIDGYEMLLEIKRFGYTLKRNETLTTAVDFLKYLHKNIIYCNYPNFAIALRIVLTCPLTVAGAERSFSKLKLIKTVQRSTMNDDRLNDLATLSIENKVARSLNYDDIITELLRVNREE